MTQNPSRTLIALVEKRLEEMESGAVQPISSEDFWKSVLQIGKRGKVQQK